MLLIGEPAAATPTLRMLWLKVGSDIWLAWRPMLACGSAALLPEEAAARPTGPSLPKKQLRKEVLAASQADWWCWPNPRRRCPPAVDGGAEAARGAVLAYRGRHATRATRRVVPVSARRGLDSTTGPAGSSSSSSMGVSVPHFVPEFARARRRSRRSRSSADQPLALAFPACC